MAEYEFNNENGSNKKSEVSYKYFSRIKLSGADGSKSLSFGFNSGLLNIKISEYNGGWNDLEIFYLSPTKARLFAQEIEKFIEYYKKGDIKNGVAFGVNGGMGDKVSYIGIHADTDKNIYITIGKFDDEGNIIEANSVQLNTDDYHYALEWTDIDMMKVNKSYDNLLEVYQILDMVKDFGRFMTGSLGYAVADLARYNIYSVLSKMDPIYEKLGIERRSDYYNKNANNNFLNNIGNTNKGLGSTGSTKINNLDDFEDDMAEE